MLESPLACRMGGAGAAMMTAGPRRCDEGYASVIRSRQALNGKQPVAKRKTAERQGKTEHGGSVRGPYDTLAPARVEYRVAISSTAVMQKNPIFHHLTGNASDPARVCTVRPGSRIALMRPVCIRDPIRRHFGSNVHGSV